MKRDFIVTITYDQPNFGPCRKVFVVWADEESARDHAEAHAQSLRNVKYTVTSITVEPAKEIRDGLDEAVALIKTHAIDEDAGEEAPDCVAVLEKLRASLGELK